MAIVDAVTGGILHLNHFAVRLLEIPQDVNWRELTMGDFLVRRKDWSIFGDHARAYGVQKELRLLVKTWRESVFVVGVRARYIDTVFPAYFALVQRYQPLVV